MPHGRQLAQQNGPPWHWRGMGREGEIRITKPLRVDREQAEGPL